MQASGKAGRLGYPQGGCGGMRDEGWYSSPKLGVGLIWRNEIGIGIGLIGTGVDIGRYIRVGIGILRY